MFLLNTLFDRSVRRTCSNLRKSWSPIWHHWHRCGCSWLPIWSLIPSLHRSLPVHTLSRCCCCCCCSLAAAATAVFSCQPNTTVLALAAHLQAGIRASEATFQSICAGERALRSVLVGVRQSTLSWQLRTDIRSATSCVNLTEPITSPVKTSSSQLITSHKSATLGDSNEESS